MKKILIICLLSILIICGVGVGAYYCLRPAVLSPQEQAKVDSQYKTINMNKAFAIGNTNNLLLKPDVCKLYRTIDKQDLYFDYYKAKQGDSLKPSIIFLYGGSFLSWNRRNPKYQKWIKGLVDNGYSVFMVDYRLGLIGRKITGVASAYELKRAVNLGVNDLFFFIDYLKQHKKEYNVNLNNLVLSGTSAGAIIALESEYYIANDRKICDILPKGFNFKGLMAFSGGIVSLRGNLELKHKFCPTFLVHGTADDVVPYNQVKFLWIGFFGSNKIIHILKKTHTNYEITRYEEQGHDISEHPDISLAAQLKFLDYNVIHNIPIKYDISIYDPRLPKKSKFTSFKDLYK